MKQLVIFLISTSSIKHNSLSHLVLMSFTQPLACLLALSKKHTSASAIIIVNMDLPFSKRLPFKCESNIFFATGTLIGLLSPDGILVMLGRPLISVALMKMS